MSYEDSSSDIDQLPTLIPAGSPRSLHEEVYGLGGSTQFDSNGDARVFYPDDRDAVVKARSGLMVSADVVIDLIDH